MAAASSMWVTAHRAHSRWQQDRVGSFYLHLRKGGTCAYMWTLRGTNGTSHHSDQKVFGKRQRALTVRWKKRWLSIIPIMTSDSRSTCSGMFSWLSTPTAMKSKMNLPLRLCLVLGKLSEGSWAIGNHFWVNLRWRGSITWIQHIIHLF